MSAAITRSKIAGHSSLLPAVLGHVGPHAGGDVVIDRADALDLDPVSPHDLHRDVHQPLGVGDLGASLQGAVDEHRPQVRVVGLASLAQLRLLLVEDVSIAHGSSLVGGARSLGRCADCSPESVGAVGSVTRRRARASLRGDADDRPARRRDARAGVAERLAEIAARGGLGAGAARALPLVRPGDLQPGVLHLRSRGADGAGAAASRSSSAAPPQAIASLEAIGVGAVGLANNHALDYETEALDRHPGAAARRRGSRSPARGATWARPAAAAIVEAGGARVGLVAVSDHPAEFAAGARPPGHRLRGPSPRDSRTGSPTELAAAARGVRLADRLPPLGPEHDHRARRAGSARRPRRCRRRAPTWSPATRRTSSTASAGETRGPLLFDLGDALDDYAVDPRLRNDLGLLAIWRPGDPSAELELVGLALDYCHTRLAEGDDAEWIAARLERACADPGPASSGFRAALSAVGGYFRLPMNAQSALSVDLGRSRRFRRSWDSRGSWPHPAALLAVAVEPALDDRLGGGIVGIECSRSRP